MRSPYEILGVSPEADPDEIRSAYRALVRSEHPDRNGGTSEANERFLEVQAAYEFLIDPERRFEVDAIRRKAQLRRRRERLRRLYQS